jgi:putative transposase
VSRRFVSEYAGEYPVKRLCELVEVPWSSFYEGARRTLSKHYLDDVELANEIYEIHVASRRTYGSPRVEGQLRHRGQRHSRKRVARLMAECGLVRAHARRKWRRARRTPRRHRTCWSVTSPRLVPISGGLPTSPSSPAGTASSTWAGIKDLHDQGLAGWSMEERQTTDLVVNALVMALARRAPEGELIHHADRGSQPVHVARVHQPARRLETPRVLRLDWRLLR